MENLLCCCSGLERETSVDIDGNPVTYILGSHVLRKTGYLIAVWGLTMAVGNLVLGDDDRTSNLMKSARHSDVRVASNYLDGAPSMQDTMSRYPAFDSRVGPWSSIYISDRSGAEHRMIAKSDAHTDMSLPQLAEWFFHTLSEIPRDYHSMSQLQIHEQIRGFAAAATAEEQYRDLVVQYVAPQFQGLLIQGFHSCLESIIVRREREQANGDTVSGVTGATGTASGAMKMATGATGTASGAMNMATGAMGMVTGVTGATGTASGAINMASGAMGMVTGVTGATGTASGAINMTTGAMGMVTGVTGATGATGTASGAINMTTGAMGMVTGATSTASTSTASAAMNMATDANNAKANESFAAVFPKDAPKVDWPIHINYQDEIQDAKNDKKKQVLLCVEATQYVLSLMDEGNVFQESVMNYIRKVSKVSACLQHCYAGNIDELVRCNPTWAATSYSCVNTAAKHGISFRKRKSRN
jgi:hypothetical protein